MTHRKQQNIFFHANRRVIIFLLQYNNNKALNCLSQSMMTGLEHHTAAARAGAPTGPGPTQTGPAGTDRGAVTQVTSGHDPDLTTRMGM